MSRDLRPYKKSQLRHGAFDELTPDAAYWNGFLFAGGSVIGRDSVNVTSCGATRQGAVR